MARADVSSAAERLERVATWLGRKAHSASAEPAMNSDQPNEAIERLWVVDEVIETVKKISTW